MKMLRFLWLALWVLCIGRSMAQYSPQSTVLSIDGQPVSLEEFDNIFRKNNRDSVITRQALDEYMELFINFKLKVLEAKLAGLDTVKKFKQELEGYRAQLARPYLTDSELLNDLVREAYERMQWEVRASHILIKCDASASPADTLKAYNRIMALRSRIIAGEDFGAVAKGKDGSEDSYANNNDGDLGYFTAFSMVHEFEDAAYRTPVGQISQPVRTKYGYHILKVTDKRPARGEVHVAHIMIKEPKDNTVGATNAQARINEIYEKLKAGEIFEQLALQYSEDNSSSKNGGELPWFGTGKMVPEFEEQAFALKNDQDYSKPFRTEYGWHIVKRLGSRPVGTFKELEKEIKNKVSKDARSEKTRKSFIEKLKKEYNYQYFGKNVLKLAAAADTGVFEGKLKASKGLLKKPMYSLNGQKQTLSAFHKYLTGRNGVRTKLTPKEYVLAEARTFTNNAILSYEDSQLEKKYPPFRLLMNEYREGILLFELTDRMVWGKASKDTLGLQEYYENHKQNFMWPRRVNCTIYSCASSKLADQVRKGLSTGKTRSQLADELNTGSQLNLQVEEGVFTAEDRDVLKQIDWIKGVSRNVDWNGRTYVVDIAEVLEPAPKKLSEARGLVASEYQNQLEKEWINELRQKHRYEVNRDVLYSIK